MTFKKLAEYFVQLELTTSRLKMTEILSELFKEAGEEEIGQICFLLQGRVAPQFVPLEFGIADKMMVRAVAQAMKTNIEDVTKEFKRIGDLGEAIFKLKAPTFAKATAGKQNFKVSDIYNVLYQVATSTGEGSQEEKVTLLGNVLKEIDPLSARFIVGITLGKLRLGFSDMTILDSLSWMIDGNKTHRGEIERAYNVRPDLSFISTTLKKKGLNGLKSTQPTVGTPILMAKADRLKNSKEILEKIGRCAVEFKYDGLRLQVHFQKIKTVSDLAITKTENLMLFDDQPKEFVRLFSRNLDDLTPMFPEIVAAVKKNIKAKEAIFEGEVVAFNPQTGVSIAFQNTMQRRRKYDIEKKAAEIPVKLYTFELLYLDGKNLIGAPYKERKELLKKIIREDKVLQYAHETIVDKEEEIEKLFDTSVTEGFEGIIAKRMDGVYQAGMRGFNWIKFKKAMSKTLQDTFDVLVMGYTMGEGKRTVFGIGEFLTGVYDASKDQFVTLTKIGTGLTDEKFRELKKRIKPMEVKVKPKNYLIDKLLDVDIWLEPKLVVEISADIITRSKEHTAGRIMGPSKSGKGEIVKTPGYSLRFPRLERFRQDKTPGEITTLSEIEKMYRSQSA